MRGQKGFSLIKSNIFATSDLLKLNASQNVKKKLCWACQKEKHTKDGHVNIQPNFFKFVCKDCLDAKAAKKASAV
jgi:hypothetical protein